MGTRRFAAAVLACTAIAVSMTAGTAQAGLLGNLLGGVTQVLTPPTSTTTTSTTSTTSALGGVVAGTTTTLSNTVGGLLGTVLPPPVTQALNVIPAGYDPITPLQQLLGGQIGLPNLLQGLTCKPLTEVAQLVKLTGLDPIADGLTTLACNAGILEYKFFTRFKNADGSTIERTQIATLGVPTPLNVDGDAVPDLIGTITFTGLNSVGLVIDRALGTTATLPTSVEAVISDPGGGLLGRRQLAIGYDARMDRAPGSFRISTPLDTILKPSPHVTATLAQQQRGNRIALLAGAFDGTPSVRLNPAQVRLDYSASPDAATFDVNLGDTTSLALTTNRPGQATLSGSIVNGPAETRFDADVGDLPTSLNLTFATQGGLHATYGASARVARLTGSFAQITHGATDRVDQKALVDLTDVPTGLDVRQDSAGGAITTTGGALGLARVGIANGEPKFLTDPAYVDVDDNGTLRSISAQVPGVENATFSLGAAPKLSATLQPTPLHARIAEPGRTIDAMVRNVPHQLDVTLDLNGGVLDYDGHGDGIGSLTLDATSTTPFFARASKLKGTLTGIPARLTAHLGATDGGIGITADGSGPIQKIELLASNGPEDLPAGDGQGAIYRDLTGGDFLVSARLLDFRGLTFSATNGLHADLQTRGGPFTLQARTDSLEADGSIQDLPARTTIGLDTATDKLTFHGADADGHDQGIAHLDVAARTIGSTLFGRADHLRAVIDDLPASLELGLSTTGDDLGVTADNPIGRLQVVASNRTADLTTDLPAGDGQGVHYVDHSGGDYVLGARVLGFKKLVGTIGDAITLDTETAGGPFAADVSTDTLTATAHVADLPAKAKIGVDLPHGKLTFSGHDAGGDPAGIATLDVDATSTRPLFGRATVVHGHVTDIPAELTLDIAQSGSGIGVDASDPIGLIELVAANRPVQADDLPLGGEQGVKYIDHAGGDFVLGARVRKLKSAHVTTGTPLQLSLQTEGGPFGVRVDTDDLSALARIEDLPAKLDATLDLAAGTITVAGKDANGDDATIGRIVVDAHGAHALFQRATDVHADVRGIPANLRLDLAQADGGVDLRASDPIDSIEVVARNGAIGDPSAFLPPAGEQGASFTDVTGGDYLIAARVLELQHLAASVQGTVHIAATTAGGPFSLHARTDDLTGDATIQNLPHDFDATVDLADGKLVVAGKDGDGNPQGIDAIHVDLHGAHALFGRATDVVADFAQVPGNLALNIAQDGGGVRLSSQDADGADNPIGSLQIVAADRPIDLSTDLPAGQGAVYHDTPDEFLLGARVNRLSLVDVSLTPSISLRAKTAGGPFDVDVRTADLTASGSFHDLPADVTLGLDPSAGSLTFTGKNADGDPQGIDSTHLVATSAQPFFAGARRLALEIDKLAPTVTLNLANNGTGGSITADQSIDRVQFVASSDPTPQPFPSSIPDGEQGAIYHDTAGGFLLAARVLDLRSLTFALAGDQVSLSSRVRQTPFTVDLDAAGITASARIDKLPAQADLDIDLHSGHFAYTGKDADGNDAGVDRIDFSADAPSDAPLFGAATKLRGSLIGVPAHIDVGFDQSGGAVNVTTTGDGITELDFLAANDPDATYPATQGIVFHDRTDGSGHRDFEVAAKVLGLKRIVAGLGALSGGDGTIGLETDTAGGVFGLDLATGSLSATGTIDQLPPQAKLTVDLGTGNVQFDGSAPIHHLSLSADSDEAILGGAKHLRADIGDLPQSVTLGVSQSQGEATIEAHDADGHPVTIGSIEIAAYSDHEELPADGDQGVVYRNVTTGSDPLFRLGARISQLQMLKASFTDALTLQSQTAGGPFSANVQTDTFSADVAIQDLPSAFNLNADLAQGAIAYAGSSAIDRLTADIHSDQPLIDEATKARIDMRDLPSEASIALNTGGDEGAPQSLSLTAGTGTIGQIDIQAADASSSYPDVPGGDSAAGAYLDSRGSTFRLAARVFQLQQITVNLDPVSVYAKMQAGRAFNVEAHLDPAADSTSTTPIDVTAAILNLPSEVRLGLGENTGAGGGSAITYQASQPIGEIAISAGGLALLDGASAIQADIRGVPTAFTVALPETGNLASLAVNPGEEIGEMRLAAGATPLPGTGLNADGTNNNAVNDKFSYSQSASGGLNAGIRLTAIKTLAINLDPINLAITQNPAKTKRIDIDATLPQASGPDATVSGFLDKPSASTGVGVTITPGAPTRLNLTNGSPMAHLGLDIANLGSIPSAHIALDNIPTTLTACLATDGTCRPTDRVPAALSNYSPNVGGSPAQNATAGGMNRPYAAQVSIDLDDHGSSGSSSATSSMTTMNATINLDSGDPVKVTNVRFHRLALDLGQNGTFGAFTTTIPRLYLFIDSGNRPYVMNEIKYPPTIDSFKVGTDGSPATADRRLVWLPGGKCGGAIVFGKCVGITVLDNRASGSHNCGGQRNLSIQAGFLGTINVLDFPLVGQLIPVCS